MIVSPGWRLRIKTPTDETQSGAAIKVGKIESMALCMGRSRVEKRQAFTHAAAAVQRVRGVLLQAAVGGGYR